MGLVYNEKTDDTFFVQMRLKFGAKDIEQQEHLTSESLFISKIAGYIKEEELEKLLGGGNWKHEEVVYETDQGFPTNHCVTPETITIKKK